ncbi:MAG TPA: hypothetical protein VKO42_00205, partial [Patescibacteria group bacterium]|nr:hypothetical protein [Patescibacteria group bacterium]
MNKKTAEKIVNKSILVLLLVLVFLVPIILGWQETLWNTFTLPKVVIFRSLVLLLLFLGAVKVFLSSKLVLRGPGPLFLFLGFWVFAWILSSGLSLDPGLSLWGKYDRLQGLSTLVYYPLLFLFLLLFLGKYTTIKKILAFMALASAVVAGYGIIQYVGWDPLVWSENTSFPGGRIISTLGQPNFAAHFLILVMPLTVFLFFFARRKIVKIFLLFLFLAQFSALVFTF